MEIESIIQEALEVIEVDVDRNFYIIDRKGYNEIGDDQKTFPVVLLDSQSLTSSEPVNKVNHIHSEYPSLGMLFLERTEFDNFKEDIVKGAIHRMRNLARRFIIAIVKSPHLRGTGSLINPPQLIPVYNVFDSELSGVTLIIPLKQFDNFEYCI